jgi:hypothetical protein
MTEKNGSIAWAQQQRAAGAEGVRVAAAASTRIAKLGCLLGK